MAPRSDPPYAAMVWDVDGTLAQTTELGFTSTNATLAAAGLPTITQVGFTSTIKGHRRRGGAAVRGHVGRRKHMWMVACGDDASSAASSACRLGPALCCGPSDDEGGARALQAEYLLGTRYTTPQRMAWHATGGENGGDTSAPVRARPSLLVPSPQDISTTRARAVVGDGAGGSCAA